ncbi:MAG: AAA family ATPase [Planctomycetota bacterium]
MLIRSLRGENFMKFRRIQLKGVPGRGVIGIEGRNEGGKSTVGELLQFAFFGKTLATSQSSILDLIHWDHDHSVVELDFEVEGRGAFRIWREIDRYGTNFARLFRLDDRAEVASGILQVQRELESLLRYDFADFVRSFYLAEKEYPRTPERMREFLDRMVGIDVLQKVAEEVGTDIAELERGFGRVQGEIKRNNQQVEKYRPNIARIPDLERLCEEQEEMLASLKEEERDREKSLRETDRTVKEREAQRNRLRDLPKKPAARFGGAVDHLLEGYPADVREGHLKESGADVRAVRMGLEKAAGLGARFHDLCARVGEAGDGLRKRLEEDEEDAYPRLEKREHERRELAGRRRVAAMAGALALLPFGALGVFVGLAEMLDWLTITLLPAPPEGIEPLALEITAMVLVRASRQRGRLLDADSRLASIDMERGLDVESTKLLDAFHKKRDSVGIEAVPDLLEGCQVTGVEESVNAYREAVDEALGAGGKQASLFQSLVAAEQRIVKRLRTLGRDQKKELARCVEAQRKLRSRRDRAGSEIREYRKQEGRCAALEEQIEELRKEAGAIRDEIETRHLLVGLLEETMDSVRHRAGPSLGKAMRKLLPNLTDERYSDLQVTPAFRLRLFTSEKSDFLGAHELSGGTLEGLSFGFRVCFSQAFIRAVTHTPQFLFLDEPFKAMDRTRVHRTLQALSRLSRELPQVFVLQPRIGDADRELFDGIIRTEVGVPELEVDLGGAEASAPPEDEIPDALAPEAGTLALDLTLRPGEEERLGGEALPKDTAEKTELIKGPLPAQADPPAERSAEKPERRGGGPAFAPRKSSRHAPAPEDPHADSKPAPPDEETAPSGGNHGSRLAARPPSPAGPVGGLGRPRVPLHRLGTGHDTAGKIRKATFGVEDAQPGKKPVAPTAEDLAPSPAPESDIPDARGDGDGESDRPSAAREKERRPRSPEGEEWTLPPEE